MAEDRSRQIAELETFLAISRQREQRLKATIRSRIADPWAKEKAEKELPEVLKSIEATENELRRLRADS
ncbi:MAG: hypothetical protein ABSA94_07760 [Acidobacteriaceae bacterium]|jgi:hypothetical protein